MYRTLWPDKSALSFDAWISILRLSTRWSFKDLRQIANEELAKRLINADPMQMLVLGEECQVSALLAYGIQELALRKDPLTLGEAGQLSLQNVLLISRLREYAALVAYTDSLNGQAFYHSTQTPLNDRVERLDANGRVKRHVEHAIKGLKLGEGCGSNFIIPLKPLQMRPSPPQPPLGMFHRD
jgi:hypothetical protein